MKDSRKGFAIPLVIAIVAVLAISGVIFMVSNNKGDSNKSNKEVQGNVSGVTTTAGVMSADIFKSTEKFEAKSFRKGIVSKTNIDSGSVFMLGVSSNSGEVDWKTILAVSSVSKVSPILLIENKNRVDDFSPRLF